MIGVSMTEGVMSLLPLTATVYLNTGKAPQPGKSQLDGGLPRYNIYETQDGKHITLAAFEYKFWHTFCTRIGHLELLPFHTPVGPGEREEALDMLPNHLQDQSPHQMPDRVGRHRRLYRPRKHHPMKSVLFLMCQ